MVFVIGSVGLADMCYNSPDENFKALMNRMRGTFSPLIYKSIIFYVSGESINGRYKRPSTLLTRDLGLSIGCPLDLVAPEVVDFLKYLVVFFDSIQSAIQNMNGQLVADVCDEQSGSKAVNATRFVSTSVCGAADLLRDLHLYLQCENWYPLYEEGVYNTMCYEGASGFSWVTSTQIAIVVFSMVILTLRVVFDDIDIVEPAPTLEQNEIKAIGSDGTDVPDDTDTRNNEEQAPLTGDENPGSLTESEDENKFADAVSDWSSIGPVEEGGGVMDSLAASEDDVYSNDESESVDDLAVSSKWEQR